MIDRLEEELQRGGRVTQREFATDAQVFTGLQFLQLELRWHGTVDSLARSLSFRINPNIVSKKYNKTIAGD